MLSIENQHFRENIYMIIDYLHLWMESGPFLTYKLGRQMPPPPQSPLVPPQNHIPPPPPPPGKVPFS